MRKRIIIRILAFLLCLNFVLDISQEMYADDLIEEEPLTRLYTTEVSSCVGTDLPQIEAGAAIVIDADSGRVLYEKNAYSRRAIASTTKIMTAIVALENGNLDDTVKVSKRASSIWGSTIKLREGEELTLRELMYGMMLKSGNDAALAVAEHIGGTVENFVKMMNDKAKELGLTNTSFKTPHGLDADGHYSTAYELAVLTQYALKNPVFSKIVSTQNISIGNRNLYSTNEMLSLYPGADGVKTGYTGKAGRCLVTSAKRDGFRLISVVLFCSSRAKRAESSKKILDYAFSNYKPYELVKPNQKLGEVDVKRGLKNNVSVVSIEGIKIPLSEKEKEALKTEITLNNPVSSPVHMGVEVGTISFYVEGKLYAQAGIKTAESVPAKTYRHYFGDVMNVWFKLVRQ
ncbi:MAG TPA: D-alanyl-D-alanine carboxypeptidase family protein [Acetivibrio sp.]|nr:D-alanyl-D-alanine carboxypeptidase family protein [Acetivibrio sp.]